MVEVRPIHLRQRRWCEIDARDQTVFVLETKDVESLRAEDPKKRSTPRNLLYLDVSVHFSGPNATKGEEIDGEGRRGGRREGVSK